MNNNYINKIRERNYSLETLMLCTPYEERNSRDLDKLLKAQELEEEFNSEIFTEPRYTYEMEKIDNQINEKRSSNDESDKKDIPMLETQRGQLLQKESNLSEFENMLLNCHSSASIAKLIAYPGSGKTTYLHNFSYKNKDIVKTIFFDFTKHDEKIYLLGNELKLHLDNGAFDIKNATHKFISMLFCVINDLISYKNLSITWEDNKLYRYKEYLNRISSNYFKRFDETIADSPLHTEFDEFFEIIKKYSENNEQNTDDKALHKKNTKEIVTFFNDKLCNTGMKVKDVISMLLKFITIINISALSEQQFTTDYKFLYIFDNIEYYIDNDVIYDEDIILINEALSLFAKHANKYLNDGMSNCMDSFNGHFKLLLSIRNTTNFIKDSKHDEDFATNQREITDIFDIEQIHNKRHEFFIKNDLLSDEQKEVFNTIIRVLNDNTIYNNSSAKVIEELYNQNKRRTTKYLCSIFSDKKKRTEYNDFRDTIEHMDGSEIKRYLKNASRSYVIRLLLSDIEKTKYFSDILTVGNNASLGKSFARRIITYLYIQKYIKMNTSYIGFYSLMKGVFESPCDGRIESLEETCDKVAKVLIKMNDPDMDKTNWCQLVIIQFIPNRSINDKILSEELKNAYLSKKDDVENLGIMITNSGVAYLKLMPHFEYFACRYVPDSMPLYSRDNLVASNTNKNNFGCMEIIRRVKDQTFKCVDEIYNNDISFFSTSYKRSDGKSDFSVMYYRDYLIDSKPHILNILYSHIGYLDNFRGYILLSADDKTDSSIFCITREDKLKLDRFLIRVLKEYIDKLEFFSKATDGQGNKYIIEETLPDRIATFKNKLNAESKIHANGDMTFHSIFE